MNGDELAAWQVRLESEVQDLALLVQELQAEVVALVPTEGTAPAAGQSVLDADLEALDLWLSEWLLPTFPRAVTPSWRWCPRWFEHAEAVLRLEALRRLWATAQTDPAGRATLQWLREADAQLAALADGAGTFASCSEREHRPVQPITTTPVPTAQNSVQVREVRD